jgi:phage tail sheath gpL-like
MGAEIALLGLSSNWPIPGQYAQLAFAQGPANGGGANNAILLMGGMLASGSASPAIVYGNGTPVSFNTETDIINLFGAGSELHRMWLEVANFNETSPLFAIPVAEGGSATASFGYISFCGAATASANLRVWVADQFVDTGVAVNDTSATQATNVVNNINSNIRWPVTASSTTAAAWSTGATVVAGQARLGAAGVILYTAGGVTGSSAPTSSGTDGTATCIYVAMTTPAAQTVTLTSKQKGLRANLIRWFALLTPSTSGVSLVPTASALMAGGTVADSFTNALAAIAGLTFYYIVSAAGSEDITSTSGNLNALITQVQNQALPTTGIIQRVVYGSQDTVSNVQTATSGENAFRAECAWLLQSDRPPCQLAAKMAAIYALGEQGFPPIQNFDGYNNTSPGWDIKAPMSGAVATTAQIAGAILLGVSPIQVLPSGQTQLVIRATNHCFSSGTTLDSRCRDGNKVTVPDLFWAYLKAQEVAQMSQKVIGNNPVPGGQPPGPNVCTPNMYQAIIVNLLNLFDANGLLKNFSQILADLQVQISNTTPTRLTAMVPLQVADCLHQVATLVEQVG